MEKNKTQKIVIVAIVFTAIVIISLTAYLANVNKKRTEFAERLAEYNTNQNTENIESASTEIGKNVEKASEEYNVINVEVKDTEDNTTNTADDTNSVTSTTNRKEENITKTNTVTEKPKRTSTSNTVSSNSKPVNEKNKKEEKKENQVKEEKEDIKFSIPVKGEILREFAQDSLVYSETLQEWVIHNGVDIKADKTSVVSSAASGTVYAIKNDPRYGLTVIINHDDGYQTVYSNLLTSEFVVEGEEVKEGQSIGTVGNTASFETADDAHLHFELIKDNKYINPTTCIEF